MSQMGGQTLNIGQALLAGIVPMLGELAEYAGVGALGGAILGAIPVPLDEATVPVGAAAGAEFGILLFGRIGLAKILFHSIVHLDRFATLAKDATELAVYAGEDRRRQSRIRHPLRRQTLRRRHRRTLVGHPSSLDHVPAETRRRNGRCRGRQNPQRRHENREATQPVKELFGLPLTRNFRQLLGE